MLCRVLMRRTRATNKLIRFCVLLAVLLFTAGTLRPLLKLTLYAESAAPVTKGIYLRKREDLILRIEARSPNDDEGTYRLFFGGSFEPMVGGPEIAENETPAEPKTETGATGRKTKRVSSVGARIAEPE